MAIKLILKRGLTKLITQRKIDTQNDSEYSETKAFKEQLKKDKYIPDPKKSFSEQLYEQQAQIFKCYYYGKLDEKLTHWDTMVENAVSAAEKCP